MRQTVWWRWYHTVCAWGGCSSTGGSPASTTRRGRNWSWRSWWSTILRLEASPNRYPFLFLWKTHNICVVPSHHTFWDHYEQSNPWTVQGFKLLFTDYFWFVRMRLCPDHMTVSTCDSCTAHRQVAIVGQHCLCKRLQGTCFSWMSSLSLEAGSLVQMPDTDAVRGILLGASIKAWGVALSLHFVCHIMSTTYRMKT